MISRRAALILAVAAALPSRAAATSDADEPPVIAAAADLQFAVTEIAARFRQESGREVKLSFGSTGNFARQIREGAPYQMFMAADESFVIDLARDGYTRGDGAIYAEGRIVIMVPRGSALVADGTLQSLRAALEHKRISHFAIANPEHAPYGRRAEEALRHAGLWQQIQPFLVLGENVGQAAQFALSGNAEGGIIAYSLALSPQLAEQGAHALIPADWHQPLLQRMVLLKNAGPVAEAFYAYMSSPAARAIMARYGFILPGEQG
jgi:molybdate transport system substrate-binding protein